MEEKREENFEEGKVRSARRRPTRRNYNKKKEILTLGALISLFS